MVIITRRAHAALGEQVARLATLDAGVAVIWLPAQYDLVRTGEGRAQWMQEFNRWVVLVRPLKELEPQAHQVTDIGGLRVFFEPDGSGAEHVTVDFVEREF